MENNLGSFKTLEDVCLKTTYNIEAGNRTFEEGEIIAFFDKIQISGLTEFKDYVAAQGGFDNRGHVFWETTKELSLTFSQGVFSPLQFSILNNAKILIPDNTEPLLLTKLEYLESNEEGIVPISEVPVDQLFVYDRDTGERIYAYMSESQLVINTPFKDVMVSYRYNYSEGAQIVKIGQRFINGFLELEGKTRVKDDTSGLVTTGIIKIPKLKLMSGLSIRLGAQANPVVGTFKGVGVPVGSRNNSYVMEFDFLNSDIDSDM